MEEFKRSSDKTVMHRMMQFQQRLLHGRPESSSEKEVPEQRKWLAKRDKPWLSYLGSKVEKVYLDHLNHPLQRGDYLVARIEQKVVVDLKFNFRKKKTKKKGKKEIEGFIFIEFKQVEIGRLKVYEKFMKLL